MTTLTNKVLKTELFFLFLLTSISLAAFYFGEQLPDNYLSISSGQNDLGIFSYVYSSLVVAIGYYLGPWTIVPFLLFALFYTLQFSKRDIPLDGLNFISVTGGSLFLFYSFAPEFLGKGIRYLIKGHFSFYEALAIGLIFSVAFLAGSFRASFKEASIQFFSFLGRLPGNLWRFLINIRPIQAAHDLANYWRRFKETFLVRLPNILKGNSQSRIRELPKQESSSVLRNKFKLPKFSRKKETQDDLTSEVNFTPIREASAAEDYQIEDVESESTEKTYVQETFTPETQENLAKKQYRAKNGQKEEKLYYDIVTTMTDPREKRSQRHPDDDYFENIIRKIEDTLSEFGIEGQIVNILKGPVVDTFELELGSGVKVSKVTNAENEISMALLGAPIRIVYPMIGRATVGIEVPRNPREIIYLDEVLSTKEFKSSQNRLPISMGKDAFGEPLVVDLASMPHMLVAGATGAGKSVFINTLLVSLLVKKSPDQMKLILIDPKQLELALYSSLPHLILPVVTDAKTASISLLWACQEMERRYSILKEFGVRNIEGFNDKLKKATPEMFAKIHQYYENEPEEHYELPYLVIIVDEFADLILTKAGKEIENNICRLAAKARAAGIHLVLATQRPSVDVITGLIKSNFPTRVSFRVTSSQDSRTILNSMGAEKLLGKGDMLYRHGTNNQRVHSAYVDEDEIEALTDKLGQMRRDYHSGAMEFLDNGGEEAQDPYAFGSHIPGSSSEPSSDEDYFRAAVKTVVEHRTASASMLQRRLKIGYNRAANLIEEMEAKGIVGPAEGSKRRKVLWTMEDLGSP
ncbi:MAG: DUF87 domain-containing protein [Bacteriovoracaceae bacterium]|nr:DUF87 domain-containing protein [Bacteriovoracaceae bacterium]